MERQASMIIARATRSGSSASAVRRASRATAARYQSSSASSSTSSPLVPFYENPSFTPALPEGRSKAYDLSLAYIKQHQEATRRQIEELRSQPASPETHEQITKLEIATYINDPVVRRDFAAHAGRKHMDKPIMRHMAERRWKAEGGLDLLMQRVYQMNVREDLTGPITGSAEIELTTTSPRRSNEAGAVIEPGSIQSASLFELPPKLRVQLYNHPEAPSAESPNPTGLYTLLVVDPDSPEYETQSYSQRVHYTKTDIPLSIASGETDLFRTSEGKELLSWEPPAPPRGTAKHRYVFAVLRQSRGPIAHLESLPRENFDFRDFAAQHGLALEAITLVRSEWTKDDLRYITQTYEKYRGEPVPIYEKPPKELKYGYPMSAKQARKEDRREEAWGRMFAELEQSLNGDGGVEVKHVE